MKRRKLSEARIQTSLARLDKGSLILFGSKTQIKGTPIFQLDTVFVVSDYLDYNPRTKPLTVADIGQTYYDYAYSKLFLGFRPNVNLRLYKGATYQNKISEMYSFVPGQVALTANTGFSRVVINGAPYINSRVNQGFKETPDLTISQISGFWRKVVEESRNQGCVEGVRFY